MTSYFLALLIGVIAGLRTMSGPATVSWAARLGWLKLGGGWLAFLGHMFTPWILTALAIVELVTDQLPQTPSRKAPLPFGARIVSGGFCGAAIGLGGGVSWLVGLVLGAFGAILGTLGGYEIRHRLAASLHRDRPAALIEDLGTATGVAFILAELA